MDVPVDLSPKPRILPPAVVVVLIQVSALNTLGPGIDVCVDANPLAIPLNVVAVFASPTIAPGVPLVTPGPTTASAHPAQSAKVLPLASPSLQKLPAPSVSTLWAYALRLAEATVTLTLSDLVT